MSTLDEITKEKQRVGEALSRVDAQRERVVSQLRELEAAERVLVRYTTGPQARKTSSAKMSTRVTVPATPARLRGRQLTTTAIPAGARRGASNLSDQVLALATGRARNHRRMQGRSPEPRRRRHCPAQASWPHRRAR